MMINSPSQINSSEPTQGLPFGLSLVIIVLLDLEISTVSDCYVITSKSASPAGSCHQIGSFLILEILALNQIT